MKGRRTILEIRYLHGDIPLTVQLYILSNWIFQINRFDSFANYVRIELCVGPGLAVDSDLDGAWSWVENDSVINAWHNLFRDVLHISKVVIVFLQVFSSGFLDGCLQDTFALHLS